MILGQLVNQNGNEIVVLKRVQVGEDFPVFGLIRLHLFDDVVDHSEHVFAERSQHPKHINDVRFVVVALVLDAYHLC